MVELFQDPILSGQNVGLREYNIVGGQPLGHLSKFRGAYCWTVRKITPCVSVMKPYIRALLIQGRGVLRRELVACLHSGRALRVPRA